MPRKADIPADLFFDEPTTKQKRTKPSTATDDKTLKRQNVKLSRAKDREAEAAKPVGRPPMQEGPKTPVTLYLTEPVLRRLEEARYVLMSNYGVKTSKSALADYALGRALADLDVVAEDLGE